MQNLRVVGGAVLFLLAARDANPLLGQPPHRWRVQADIGVGAFLPASGLGTIGVTGAKYQPSSTVGVGIELRPRAGALALRLSTQRSLSSGIDFHATSDCQQNCVGPWSVDHGRFWGAAIDAVARPISGPLDFTFALGGGLRQYHVGTFDCVCIASPPGSPDDGPFLKDQIAAALHGLAAMGIRSGRVSVRVGAEDYVSKGPARHTQHDLVVSASIAGYLRR